MAAAERRATLLAFSCFIIVCLLSRMAGGRTPQGLLGLCSIRSSVRRLLHDAEVLRLSATQDAWVVIALTHAIQSRCLAQVAFDLASAHGLNQEFGPQALDIVTAAQVLEDESLKELAGWSTKEDA